MICPKCHKRMKCLDSFNEVETMRTARRYKCEYCNNRLHTIEKVADALEVNYVLSKKQEGRKRK